MNTYMNKWAKENWIYVTSNSRKREFFFDGAFDKETRIIRTAGRDRYIMHRPISRVISLQSEEGNQPCLNTQRQARERQ